MSKDPVCGMEVNDATAAQKAAYDGGMFYFCSASCKEKFVKEPAKYTGGAVKSAPGCCGGSH